MNSTPQAWSQSNSRIYVLQRPSALAAAPAVPVSLPPRQPLPRAVIDPGKPLLKLGLLIAGALQRIDKPLPAPKIFAP